MVMSHLIRGNFCRDGDGDKNVKRAISLDWQNNRQQLYTCIALFVISLRSLQDYDVKLPNFLFYRQCKQTIYKESHLG